MSVDTYNHSLELCTTEASQVMPSEIRGIQIDHEKRCVYIDGHLLEHRLSKKEVRLFALLSSDPGKIFTRSETTRAVYNEVYTPGRDDERLDALVERARRHIGDSSRTPRFLETLRGRGHRLKEYIDPLR